MTALEAAYLAVKDRWPGSFSEFADSIKGCEVHAVELDGETVGAIIVSGPDIHACIHKGFGRWFRRPQAAILNRVIERHGYAQTHATTQAGKRFVERLGFERHGECYRRYTKWD